jgi:hypothetical protein
MFRVACLVTEDRRGFKADESGQRKKNCDSQGAGRSRFWGEGCASDAFGAAADEHCDIEDDDDGDLQDESNTEDLGAQLDMAVSKETD